MHTVFERRQAARFLCRAAWRCRTCDTPWFAVENVVMARRLAGHHEYAHHG